MRESAQEQVIIIIIMILMLWRQDEEEKKQGNSLARRTAACRGAWNRMPVPMWKILAIFSVLFHRYMVENNVDG